MENNYRKEALLRLKENGVSLVNMEVYIQGYVDGRIDNNSPKDSFIESKESLDWVEDMKQTFKDLGY